MQEFGVIFTNKLSNELPPKREVDHKIELTLGVGPQNKALYRLKQIKQANLKHQLIKLLVKGYTQSSKSSFKTLMFFVNKKDGQIRMRIDY